MKKKSITGIIIILTIGLLFLSCGGEQGKFQGEWQSDDGNDHFIVKGNNFIYLVKGNEQSRGTFTTDFKVSKDNKFIILNVEYQTYYLKGEKPAASRVEGSQEFKYTFLNNKLLEIEKFDTFTKTKIPAANIKKIEDTFTENRKNPDLRNTVKHNGKVYSELYDISDIKGIIKQGNFEDAYLERDVINGVFSNNRLHFIINKVYIDSPQFVNGAGKIDTGDKIILKPRSNSPPESSLDAIYTGDTISSFISSYMSWGFRQYKHFTIIGTVLIENGVSSVEIIDIEESRYYSPFD